MNKCMKKRQEKGARKKSLTNLEEKAVAAFLKLSDDEKKQIIESLKKRLYS